MQDLDKVVDFKADLLMTFLEMYLVIFSVEVQDLRIEQGEVPI